MSIDKYTQENCFTCAQLFYGDEACYKYHNSCLPIKKMVTEYIQNVTPFPPLNIVVCAAALGRMAKVTLFAKRACHIKKEALNSERKCEA